MGKVQKMVEDLRNGKNDQKTLHEAATLLEDRAFHERTMQMNYYSFCTAMGFLTILVIVVCFTLV